jgi:anti-sigma B factor antagonist
MNALYKLREQGKHTVISFDTPTLMNVNDVERLRGDLLRLVDESKRTHLVLDFTGVQFISSQLIGVLLSLHKKLTAAGGTLTLCGLGLQLVELIKITRLDRILSIKATSGEAVGA